MLSVAKGSSTFRLTLLFPSEYFWPCTHFFYTSFNKINIMPHHAIWALFRIASPCGMFLPDIPSSIALPADVFPRFLSFSSCFYWPLNSPEFFYFVVFCFVLTFVTCKPYGAHSDESKQHCSKANNLVLQVFHIIELSRSGKGIQRYGLPDAVLVCYPHHLLLLWETVKLLLQILICRFIFFFFAAAKQSEKIIQV